MPRRGRPVRGAARRAVRRDRPAHRGDDQVRRQLVPRHARSRSSTRSPACASRSASTSTRSSMASRCDPRIGRHFFQRRDRVRRQLPAQGRRSPALHRRDPRRRDAGPVRGPGGQHDAADGARSGAFADASGTLEGKVIGVWGLTFKGDTEDTRESPAMDVVGAPACNEGAHVRAYDPAVAADRSDLPAHLHGHGRGRRRSRRPRGADALAILTDWPEFRVDRRSTTSARRCAAP